MYSNKKDSIHMVAYNKSIEFSDEQEKKIIVWVNYKNKGLNERWKYDCR